MDQRADGNGQAATTWIAMELLPEKHAMCEEWKRWAGTGWEGSDLRRWLQGEVLQAFPTILRNRLVSVKKQQSFYDEKLKKRTQTTSDSLWIPSYPEVFGGDSLYYGLFEDRDANRVKTRGGSAAWWWLRSARGNNYFMFVTNSGYYNGTGADFSGGVALGFCL